MPAHIRADRVAPLVRGLPPEAAAQAGAADTGEEHRPPGQRRVLQEDVPRDRRVGDNFFLFK